MMLHEYIPQIIVSGIVIFLTPVSKVTSRKIVENYGRSKAKSDRRIAQMIRIVNMIINFTSLLLLAIIWGVQPKNILVTLSSVFAVIGVAMFAQWSILSNITAGIIIFFTTPFRIGDEIHILDKDLPITAVIDDILTFHIHLRTDEGELIVISNSIFLQKVVSMKS